jgi:uncharacterized membrane protein HdeD (DUF308 family)
MSIDSPTPAGPLAQAIRHELEHLRQEWWWFLVLGVVLVVSGVIALIYPFIASVAAVVVLGMAMMLSGIATIVTAFWAGRWSALLLQLLVGVFYTVVGFLIMDHPLQSTVSLTLVVAVLFIVVGIMRSIAALVIRFPQWGWSLLSGALTTLVGIVIYKNFEVAALWAIGTLIGIQLIFDGWFWIMLGASLRRLPLGRL